MSHVWILGPGRLGLNLAAVHHAHGDQVQLVGRSAGPWQEWAQLRQIPCWIDDSAQGAGHGNQAGSACELEGMREIWQAAHFSPHSSIIFAIPDAQLAKRAAAWAQLARDQGTQLQQVVHVSGFHGLEVLQPWQACAKQLIVAHPARPFAPQPDPQALQAVPTTVLCQKQGEIANIELGALQAWQADWIELNANPQTRSTASQTAPGLQRAAYHAACSLAANHLTALFAEAEAIFAEQMDAEQARRITASLARHALQACAELGPKDALTGPALRGDQAVLDAHLEALPAACRALYQAQLESVLRLAAQARSGS